MNPVMQVPIDDIKIDRRIRHDTGDLTPLVESLRRFGQMNPILLNKDNTLIAGGRRLAAASILGWRTINAFIVDVDDEATRLEYELEENMQRQDLSREDMELAYLRLRKLQNPGFFVRLWRAIKRLFARLFKHSKR